jgi:hypothetical protein
MFTLDTISHKILWYKSQKHHPKIEKKMKVYTSPSYYSLGDKSQLTSFIDIATATKAKSSTEPSQLIPIKSKYHQTNPVYVYIRYNFPLKCSYPYTIQSHYLRIIFCTELEFRNLHVVSPVTNI